MTLPVSIFDPAQLAYLLGIAAVLGACMGSFFNCFAWRLVHGESILHGRSHCTSCGHVLGPLDLIPVVSWVALRGKCRYCGQRVSPRYMLVELLMAVLFVVLVIRYGLGLQAAVYAALVCILLCLSLVDLETLIIPNGFVVAGCVLWLVSVWFMPTPELGQMMLGSLFTGLVGYTHWAVVLDGVAGFVLAGGFVLLMSLVVDALTGRQSLGGGDVKLLAMLGLFLGVAGSFVGLFAACIFGLIFACMQQASSSGKQDAKAPAGTVQAAARDNAPETGDAGEKPAAKEESFRMKTIPFGPSIALGACVALLVGWQLLTWYTGLF